MDVLKGYRTYLAAAGLAYLAYTEYRSGNLPSATEHFFTALGLFGLRRAIEPPVNPPPK